jgi:hypothetical protein
MAKVIPFPKQMGKAIVRIVVVKTDLWKKVKQSYPSSVTKLKSVSLGDWQHTKKHLDPDKQ